MLVYLPLNLADTRLLLQSVLEKGILGNMTWLPGWVWHSSSTQTLTITDWSANGIIAQGSVFNFAQTKWTLLWCHIIWNRQLTLSLKLAVRIFMAWLQPIRCQWHMKKNIEIEQNSVCTKAALSQNGIAKRAHKAHVSFQIKRWTRTDGD